MFCAAGGQHHADQMTWLVTVEREGSEKPVCVAESLARNYGAHILAITRADSPLAELADIVLPLQGAETSFIYKPTAARYGMLLAIDVLATELALANPEDNQERLRRIKLALDDYRGGDDHLPLGD